jgi:hypothetical protein
MNDRKMTSGDIIGKVAKSMRYVFDDLTPATMPSPGDEVTLPDGRPARVLAVDGNVITFEGRLDQISCTVGFKEPMP